MNTYFKNGQNPYFKGSIFRRNCLRKFPYPSFKIWISRKIWFCKYGLFQNTYLQIRFSLWKYILWHKYGFMPTLMKMDVYIMYKLWKSIFYQIHILDTEKSLAFRTLLTVTNVLIKSKLLKSKTSPHFIDSYRILSHNLWYPWSNSDMSYYLCT